MPATIRPRRPADGAETMHAAPPQHQHCAEHHAQQPADWSADENGEISGGAFEAGNAHHRRQQAGDEGAQKRSDGPAHDGGKQRKHIGHGGSPAPGGAFITL